jgi:hypothetical protein
MRIDELIVNLFNKRILPLSVVESKEFRQLLSFLEPEYKAFDRKCLKARIAALYEEEIANINVTQTF